MKILFTFLIIFSFASFAGSKCENIKLKDSVEACYYKELPLSMRPYNPGVYTIEYQCEEVTKISKRGESHTFTKTVKDKSHYLLHDKCMKVVDYIQKHKVFPNFWDSVDMTGEAIGM